MHSAVRHRPADRFSLYYRPARGPNGHPGYPSGYICMLTSPAPELMLAFGDLSCVRTVRSTSRLGSTFTSLASRFVSTTLRLALSRRRAPAESSLQQYSDQSVASSQSSRWQWPAISPGSP